MTKVEVLEGLVERLELAEKVAFEAWTVRFLYNLHDDFFPALDQFMTKKRFLKQKKANLKAALEET